MADNQDGAPPREIHVEEKKTNWLAWIALALGLLALLFALSRCNREAPVAVTNDTVVNETVVDNGTMTNTTMTNTTTTANNGLSGFGTYLGGTGALPYTFAFEKLNFDTSKSAIRDADRPELDALVANLKQYPKARVRVVGYADASGSAPANAALGKARAESVKAALVKGGVDAGRVEAVSGGEGNPVDTNATATGRAENRRTEVIALAR